MSTVSAPHRARLQSIATRSSWIVGWLPFTAVIAYWAPQSSIRQRAVVCWAWRASSVTTRPARPSCRDSARAAGISPRFSPTLDLPQDQATAVLDRGHHHPLPVRNPFRGAAHILAVHGHPGSVAVLPAPGAQRLVQRVRRQFREDVMKGRGRWHGVALTGRAEEPAHRLALLVVHAGRELAEGGHAAIAGQPRRDHDRQIAGKTVAPAPRLAEVGHRLKKIAQTAQFGSRHRRRLRGKPPFGRLPLSPERLPVRPPSTRAHAPP